MSDSFLFPEIWNNKVGPVLLVSSHSLVWLHFNLPSHYSKWKMKLEPEAFVFEQKKGKPDYECSKPNFYCNSIILLLITDSFSLCSWSKTSLIHYSCPPLKRRRNWQGYLLCLIYGGYFFLLWWLTEKCVRETCYVLISTYEVTRYLPNKSSHSGSWRRQKDSRWFKLVLFSFCFNLSDGGNGVCFCSYSLL